MSQSVLRIGRVIEVNGSRTVGELEASVDDLYRTHKSRKYAVGQVGSIVKIESGDRETGPGDLDRQWKTHVPHPDHTDPGGSILDLFQKSCRRCIFHL